MDDWYLPVIRLLGLEADAHDACAPSATSPRPGHWRMMLGRPCFYRRSGYDCNGSISAVGTSAVGTTSALAASRRHEERSGRFSSRHFRGASAKLLSYYTGELAGKVTKWAWRDFARFGYWPANASKLANAPPGGLHDLSAFIGLSSPEVSNGMLADLMRHDRCNRDIMVFSV